MNVPAMIWPRILVFTSMMLQVLTQQPLAVMELEVYIPKLGLIPRCIRPVRPVADQYDLLAS